MRIGYQSRAADPRQKPIALLACLLACSLLTTFLLFLMPLSSKYEGPWQCGPKEGPVRVPVSRERSVETRPYRKHYTPPFSLLQGRRKKMTALKPGCQPRRWQVSPTSALGQSMMACSRASAPQTDDGQPARDTRHDAMPRRTRAGFPATTVKGGTSCDGRGQLISLRALPSQARPGQVGRWQTNVPL